MARDVYAMTGRDLAYLPDDEFDAAVAELRAKRAARVARADAATKAARTAAAAEARDWELVRNGQPERGWGWP